MDMIKRIYTLMKGRNWSNYKLAVESGLDSAFQSRSFFHVFPDFRSQPSLPKKFPTPSPAIGKYPDIEHRLLYYVNREKHLLISEITCLFFNILHSISYRILQLYRHVG